MKIKLTCLLVVWSLTISSMSRRGWIVRGSRAKKSLARKQKQLDRDLCQNPHCNKYPLINNTPPLSKIGITKFNIHHITRSSSRAAIKELTKYNVLNHGENGPPPNKQISPPPCDNNRSFVTWRILCRNETRGGRMEIF